ncbi:copper resistance protein CopC [Pandoraea horticolens]|uniref:Copper resistance protein CopC n=2 Tax=Pandoraea horticolens TaxID=2508298 RepID=A0A5E4RPF4_9BURK|nr:copper resistance protein CopC [Pandoraea horticolens]
MRAGSAADCPGVGCTTGCAQVAGAPASAAFQTFPTFPSFFAELDMRSSKIPSHAPRTTALLRRATQGLALATVLGLAGLSQGAWAHAHAVSSEPAAQATVEAPKSVRVTFDSVLEGALSKLSVVDAQGKPVTQTKSELDAARKTLTLSLPALPAGDYQVNWTAVASDGHRTQGRFKFTVK